MRKKIFIVYSTVLLLFNQLMFVRDASAAQLVVDRNVPIGSETGKGEYSIDLDSLYSIDSDDLKGEKIITEEEMFTKTQVAPDIIKRMDTDTLLEAALRSPMIYTIENSVDRTNGTMTFLGKTNAGRALLARQDVKGSILKEYLSLEIPDKTLNDYSKINNCKDEDLHNTIMELLEDPEFAENVDKDIDIYYRIHFLEGAILSEELYPLFSVEEKRQLYNKSLKLNEAKQRSEVFSYCAEESFTTALMADAELAESIVFPSIQKAKSKEKVKVYTPKGTAVSATKYSNNHVNSAEYVTSFESKPENKSRTVKAKGYSHSNCHAYTWPGRHDVWMNSPGAFLTDGSYKKISSGGRATANYQKVNSSGHSAIIVNYSKENQRIRTKTGGSPIYECDLKVDFTGSYDIYDSVC